MLEFIGKTITGFVIVTLLCCVIFQTDPISFIQATILISICTAGIPLILLMAVSSFAGNLVYGLSFKKNRDNFNNKQEVLTDYIMSCQQQGISKEAIFKDLLEVGGWKIDEIKEAFNKIEKAGR